jgi:SAM-dependent methyltransferase
MQQLTVDRTPRGWDVVAEAYDQQVLPFTGQFAEDALRLAEVGPGHRVLDVATGPGTLALLAARRGASVTATDFSPLMIDRLRARLTAEGVQDVATEVMDGQALALPDGSFDAAFSIFGLIFFPDRARGFRELRRVLRPGGRAVVAGWSRPERVRFASLLAEATRRAIPDLPVPAEPPAVLSLQDPSVFEREMAAAGFGEVRVHSVVHTWTTPSAEAFWQTVQVASPVFTVLLERIGPEKRDAVRDALMGLLHAEFGEGPVSLECEAHLGVGST